MSRPFARARHRALRPLTLFSAFALVLLLLCPTAAWACSCFRDGGDLESAYRSSPQVFYGRVLSVVADPTISSPLFGEGEAFLRVSFDVLRPFKGLEPGAVVYEVVTPSTGGACGYSFVPGESYLVFTQTVSRFPEPEVWSCSGTQRFEPGDLARLEAIAHGTADRSSSDGGADSASAPADAAPAPADAASRPADTAPVPGDAAPASPMREESVTQASSSSAARDGCALGAGPLDAGDHGLRWLATSMLMGALVVRRGRRVRRSDPRAL
jgi:hypothetical protein